LIYIIIAVYFIQCLDWGILILKMYELVRVGEQSYYINSLAKIGVFVENDKDVYLIDSGHNKNAGRKVKKILDEQGWQLKAIINTHSNADHIGGNQYLQQQYGCDIFAYGIEAALSRHPILEPSFLYGGYPCKYLQQKFLLAEKSDVKDISDNGFPKQLNVIELPGHFFNMIGIRTPDDVVFLADCISSIETIEKYKVTFIYDVEKHLETLTMLEKLGAKIFVPAHAQSTEDLNPLITVNRQAVLNIADKLLDICRTPTSFENILRNIFTTYELTMTFEQHVLVGSTIRSYLSWLKDKEKLTVTFKENTLLWHAI